MAKQEKTFNTKLYALVVFLLVAAILAVSSLFGSILAAWAVYNLFFKKGGKR